MAKVEQRFAGELAAKILINGSSVFISRSPLLMDDGRFTGVCSVWANKAGARPPLMLQSDKRLDLPWYVGWSAAPSMARRRFADMSANALFLAAMDSPKPARILLTRSADVCGSVVAEIGMSLSRLASCWFGLRRPGKWILKSGDWDTERDPYFCGKNTFSDYAESAYVFESWEVAMRATQQFHGCAPMRPVAAELEREAA